MFVSLPASSQVRGRVTGEQGEPLPGAVVQWLHSSTAAVSDTAGGFSIRRSPGGNRLVARYVGMVADTVTVAAGTDSVSFRLREMADLTEVKVVGRRASTYKDRGSLLNSDIITLSELRRDACCNLGESFQSNPSVDVSYSDAATGAKQIRLLGLSGSYVQMLTENIPNFRGVASPYGLGYVPGPWMQSIQVSKGISSVKNGYEAVTGQINVEYKKPQQPDADLVAVNLYGDSDARIEGNADATFRLGSRWGTTLLAHYEKSLKQHDSNGDGFADMPKMDQLNLMNRWTYTHGAYIFQGGVKVLTESRESGQVDHHGTMTGPRYAIDIDTERYEAFTKNAYTLNEARATSVALILSGSWHDQSALYGLRNFNVKQGNAYASLLFETGIDSPHALSAGLSFNYDGFSRHYRMQHDATLPLSSEREHETVGGGYLQYTYSLGEKFVAMAGLRADNSSQAGWFVTPRAHLKFMPSDRMTFRVSAGKGYRTARPLDENNYLFAGSRRVEIAPGLKQEEAWNYGASALFKLPVGGHLATLSVEYYYTHFLSQVVADMDSDPHAVLFYNLNGRSYSHVAQAEASYPFFDGFSLTAAYRYTDVRTDYGGRLLEKPLTGKMKGLLTASYKTPLELWQFDATLQLNGGGRMPEPYDLPDGSLSWERRYKAFPQLSAQITRNFRHFSVYLGGENLTNYRQKNPIVDAANPWGDNFDPAMVYAPVHGVKIYAGLRFNLSQK